MKKNTILVLIFTISFSFYGKAQNDVFIIGSSSTIELSYKNDYITLVDSIGMTDFGKSTQAYQLRNVKYEYINKHDFDVIPDAKITRKTDKAALYFKSIFNEKFKLKLDTKRDTFIIVENIEKAFYTQIDTLVLMEGIKNTTHSNLSDLDLNLKMNEKIKVACIYDACFGGYSYYLEIKRISTEKIKIKLKRLYSGKTINTQTFSYADFINPIMDSHNSSINHYNYIKKNNNLIFIAGQDVFKPYVDELLAN